MSWQENIEQIRSKVLITEHGPRNTSSFSSSGTFASINKDNSFDLEKFKEGLQINIQELNDEEIIFDLIGIDAPIANAFRRIMIGEIPTMAIEQVYIEDNSSVIQDEVLSHRLGLVPIRADPKLFDYIAPVEAEDEEEGRPPVLETVPAGNPNDTIVFTLDVTCKKKKMPDGTVKVENSAVYSRDLKWLPIGDQKEKFSHNPPKPVHGDILIANLGPGQRIVLTCHAIKGCGSEHAKWSPVATASYRLLPEIDIKTPITGANAQLLVKTCPLNVFDIEDLGGVETAVVAAPRSCTVCRECIRDKYPWAKQIELKRVKNHFIFSVETAGQLAPADLFREALRVLVQKCMNLRTALLDIEAGGTGGIRPTVGRHSGNAGDGGSSSSGSNGTLKQSNRTVLSDDQDVEMK